MRTRWSWSAGPYAGADGSTSKAGEARNSRVPKGRPRPLELAEWQRCQADSRRPAAGRGTRHQWTPARRVLPAITWRDQIAGTAGPARGRVSATESDRRGRGRGERRRRGTATARARTLQHQRPALKHDRAMDAPRLRALRPGPRARARSRH